MPGAGLDPDRDVLTTLVKAARGWLRVTTVAPELPGALEVIADLVAASLPAADVTRSRSTRSGAAAAFEGGPETRTRFERLRALRKRIADSEGVPAYIVFSDATLRHMAEINPGSRTEMATVSGVGPVKLERYGAAFLEVLREG